MLFALCYGFCEVLLLPATPLALSAGALFGVAGGTALSSCGALVGAITSFFLGRTVLRSTVLRFVGTAPWFGALERVAKRDGFKAVLLLNLSPLAGIQNVLNYAYGTTSVGARVSLLFFLIYFFFIFLFFSFFSQALARTPPRRGSPACRARGPPCPPAV